MSIKPTIVIVPGSFSPASFYAHNVAQLQDAGYEAIAIELPSVGNRSPEPPATMADDAAAIALVVQQLADQGKDVVLVAHSYGGIPATESVRGLVKKERVANGMKGGLVRLMYTTAIIPEVGASLGSTMGSDIPEHLIIEDDYMSVTPDGHARLVFSDLPEAQGLAWATNVPQHSTISFAGKLTYPGYRFVACTYLFCETDLTVPPEMQQGFVELLESNTTCHLDVMRIKSDHFPWISHPDLVLKAVKKSCGEIVEVV